MAAKKQKNKQPEQQWRTIIKQHLATIICPYCLEPIPEGHRTRDHKIPKSRGGKNEPENIVICCDKCNQEKGSLTPEEYEIWKKLNYIRCGGLSNKGKHR